MSIIDLHMHSTASDGTDGAEELLRKVMAAGIKTFSVTDHDTADCALEMEKLVPKGMNYVRGLEFSCVTAYKKCHILAYGYDPGCPELVSLLGRSRKRRTEKLFRRIDALREQFGIVFTPEESEWLMSQKSPGRPHLAEILIRRGMFSDVKTAMTQVINRCKIPNVYLDSGEAIDAVRSAGGISVWAHPLGGELDRMLPGAEFEKQLCCLRDEGIQGLECFYSLYSSAETDFLRKTADSNNLLISGGSDYHGKVKPHIALGQLNSDNLPVLPEDLSLTARIDWSAER